MDLNNKQNDIINDRLSQKYAALPANIKQNFIQDSRERDIVANQLNTGTSMNNPSSWAGQGPAGAKAAYNGNNPNGDTIGQYKSQAITALNAANTFIQQGLSGEFNNKLTKYAQAENLLNNFDKMHPELKGNIQRDANNQPTIVTNVSQDVLSKLFGNPSTQNLITTQGFDPASVMGAVQSAIPGQENKIGAGMSYTPNADGKTGTLNLGAAKASLAASRQNYLTSDVLGNTLLAKGGKSLINTISEGVGASTDNLATNAGVSASSSFTNDYTNMMANANKALSVDESGNPKLYKQPQIDKNGVPTVDNKGNPMRPSAVLALKRSVIREATGRFRTANPRVFGSVLHGTDQDGSDLDLLVDALPGATLLDLGGLQDELESLLGVHVDLLTPGDLPLKFRAKVLAEAQPV